MRKLTFVDREGREKTVDGEAGLSVMELIRDGGFDDQFAICGGCCSCGTCHVYVDAPLFDKLGPPNADEADLIQSFDYRQPNSRLACQILFEDELDGLKLWIAPVE